MYFVLRPIPSYTYTVFDSDTDRLSRDSATSRDVLPSANLRRPSVSQSVSESLVSGRQQQQRQQRALLKIQLNIELLHWISLFVNAWPASAYSKLISFPLAIDLFIYLFRFYCMLELRAAVNRYQIYFPLVLCYISRSILWGVDGWEMN